MALRGDNWLLSYILGQQWGYLIKSTVLCYTTNQICTSADCSRVCFQFRNVVNWIILDYYVVTIAKIVGASVAPVPLILKAVHSVQCVQ